MFQKKPCDKKLHLTNVAKAPENLIKGLDGWRICRGKAITIVDAGIVLAAERRNTNKLLDEVFHSEKIYKLNEDMVITMLIHNFCFS